MRSAASMIELVIAIVVMGIAMMTLPMMLTTVQNNNAFAMQQEAILIARTQLWDITTYPWDEHSVDNNFILDTNSTQYNRTNRVGLVRGDKRRKFFTTPTPTLATRASTSANFGAIADGDIIPDDIDDFDTETAFLDKNATDINATMGYKLSNDLNMTITVKYINDTNTSATFDFNQSSTSTLATNETTNIKMITVSLMNSLPDGNITLRAFSCNIGANQLLRRTF